MGLLNSKLNKIHYDMSESTYSDTERKALVKPVNQYISTNEINIRKRFKYKKLQI